MGRLTAVTRIEKQPSGHQLHTSKGTLNAKEVIIATNGYTDRLVPQLKPRIFPVGSYIIVTEPLSMELQKKLSPKGRMFYDSKWFRNGDSASFGKRQEYVSCSPFRIPIARLAAAQAVLQES